MMTTSSEPGQSTIGRLIDQLKIVGQDDRYLLAEWRETRRSPFETEPRAVTQLLVMVRERENAALLPATPQGVAVVPASESRFFRWTFDVPGGSYQITVSELVEHWPGTLCWDGTEGGRPWKSLPLRFDHGYSDIGEAIRQLGASPVQAT
jgi:hypothetical protein